MDTRPARIEPGMLLVDSDGNPVVFDAREEGNFFTASVGMPVVRGTKMQADVKRALAWGFGLGVGFAVAGMALGVFRKVR
jgi:hypothetical protein